MATPAQPAKSLVDVYFLTTPREAEWIAVPNQQPWLNEAYKWLAQLCVDQTKQCCGMSFDEAWIAANGELALALSQNPNAIIGGATTTGAQGAIKEQKLGDLSQSFYDTKDGQATATRFGPNDPKVLQAFPWIADLLDCYLTLSRLTGTRVIARVRS